MPFQKYKKAEEFLVSLANLPRWEWWHDQSRPVIYLKRMKILLKLLGNPQNSKIKFIHVTGTSGKGSTVAMIHSILQETGHKTGAYFSPYTTTAIERYFVGRQLVSPKVFAGTVEEIKPAIAEAIKISPWGAPSYVEVATAMAFLIFKKARVTHAVVEAVCGGENDSTNVIKTPLVSVITNVADDHRHILGPTLADIARNKAGIIKRGVPVVTGVTSKNLLKVIESRAGRMKAPLHVVKTPPLSSPSQGEDAKAPLRALEGVGGGYNLQIPGAFQQTNAALAYKVGQLLNIKEETILRGLKKAWLPCRMEVMQKNPTVIIDAAHNPAKIKAFVESLSFTRRGQGEVWTIVGFVERKGKNYNSMILPLTETADKLILTRALNSYFKSVDLNEFDEKLKEQFPIKSPLSRGVAPSTQERGVVPSIKRGGRAQRGRGVFSCQYLGFYLDPFEALNFVLKKAAKSDVILVTGSIYLCGEIRTRWFSEDYILKKRWAK